MTILMTGHTDESNWGRRVNTKQNSLELQKLSNCMFFFIWVVQSDLSSKAFYAEHPFKGIFKSWKVILYLETRSATWYSSDEVVYIINQILNLLWNKIQILYFLFQAIFGSLHWHTGIGCLCIMDSSAEKELSFQQFERCWIFISLAGSLDQGCGHKIVSWMCLTKWMCIPKYEHCILYR